MSNQAQRDSTVVMPYEKRSYKSPAAGEHYTPPTKIPETPGQAWEVRLRVRTQEGDKLQLLSLEYEPGLYDTELMRVFMAWATSIADEGIMCMHTPLGDVIGDFVNKAEALGTVEEGIYGKQPPDEGSR